jgi:hypothetical protein
MQLVAGGGNQHAGENGKRAAPLHDAADDLQWVNQNIAWSFKKLHGVSFQLGGDVTADQVTPSPSISSS